MTISTYGSLTTALASWLDVNSSDISAVVSDLVTMGENRIFRELRTKDMEASLNATISSGVISVPSDFVELKYAYVDGSPTQYLQSRPSAWIYERYPIRSGSGVPAFIARDGSNFIFGPYPDGTYTVKGTYYKRLSAIQSSASALVTSYPDLYLMACLAESEPLIGRDKRLPIWESKYRMIRDSIMAEETNSRFGGPLSVRVG